MNRSFKLTLAIASIAVAVGGGYWFGRQQPAMADAAGATTVASPAPAGKNERKILYYRNPMGLPDTSPEPKKDSMGMDYIAVFADDEPDGSGGRFDAECQPGARSDTRRQNRPCRTAHPGFGAARGRPGGGG